MNTITLSNARVVTADEVFTGTVRIEAGRIADVARGGTVTPAEDCGGDYLLPGLVELHTDNLEKHLGPRPGVEWPVHSALAIHDAQIAAAGITTVFDALCIGDLDPTGFRARTLRPSIAALREAVAAGSTRAEHWLHLRCEVASTDVLDLLTEYLDEPLLKLLSVMDHTPGQRQWSDLEKYRVYAQKHDHWDETRLADEVTKRSALQQAHSARNRHAVVNLARERGLALASHDDTTVEHVAEAQADGVTISEFPTTLAAARAARAAGQGIVMGAPNAVRGGSHSGNVAALDLARAELLDVFSSDYVPASLLHAAFLLVDDAGWSLPRAIATVSRNPAQMAGLTDRGEIAVGLKADLVRVRPTAHTPLVRAVWRDGERVG
ncbi:alpha-D-ribose 1-methylphosphonate 5-triphosphate diphosphatase [Chitinolyticbacter meiyuanensis]|uniref:alpha-D-ribose 1-methylphosphonate 5-triphosphate diphosphatase n=1 Tax=Chitinolyticbacter meiyuanensis TaxID=682798 RepID=UPI00165297CE|nr:alpha-D-ribose 1-methylphosphonate 5-triphosphate diphosphatase [Chitinolyticbacter meiyuanensis]